MGWNLRRETAVLLIKSCRLSGGGKDRPPQLALQIQVFSTGGDHVDRDMHELAVEVTDHESGPAGHRGVHRVAAQAVAKQRVLGVGGTATDLIAWIEVTHGHFDAAGLEVRADGIPHEMADVLEFRVSRRVGIPAFPEKVLAGSLGDDNDGVL